MPILKDEKKQQPTTETLNKTNFHEKTGKSIIQQLDISNNGYNLKQKYINSC